MRRTAWAAFASIALGGTVMAQSHNYTQQGTTPKPAVPKSLGVSTSAIPAFVAPALILPSVVPAPAPEQPKIEQAKPTAAVSVPAPSPTLPADSPATKAFKAANAKLHAGMTASFTGNADYDFMHTMVPHHEAAIEKAKTVLKHSKDPYVLKIAREIIKAQENEISLMKVWLAKNTKTQ